MLGRPAGVVGDAVYQSLREGMQPIYYGVERGNSFETFYVRSTLDLGSVIKTVERECEAVGHGTRIRDITTLDTLIGDTLLRERLLAGLGGTFAFLGLLLAAIGLFGLLNYSVSRRTKEIGMVGRELETPVCFDGRELGRRKPRCEFDASALEQFDSDGNRVDRIHTAIIAASGVFRRPARRSVSSRAVG